MDETEIDIRGILSLLRRRIRMIALTVISVVALAVLALVAITPIYTASTLIFVDTARKNLLEADFALAPGAADNARVESEVEILRSNAVLLSVIRNENLIDDPEFGISSSPGLLTQIRSLLPMGGGEQLSAQEALQQVLEKFSRAVSVQRRGLTYVISASVSSKSPARAAELANALGEAYIAEQLSSKISAISSSQAIISARLDQTSRALIETEQAFDNFITANIERLSGQEGYQDIQSLRNQIAELTRQRDSVTNIAETVNRSLEQQNWSGLVSALESDALAALERERLALSEQLRSIESGSSMAVNLREQLAALERQMTERAQLELDDLRSSLPGLTSQTETLRQQLRSTVMTSDLPIEVLTQLYELQQSAELVRAQYQTLLARNSDLQVQADLQVADSRIVAPAMAPRQPSFPNARLVLVLAGLMGLGLGVGLAFLYENYIGGFTSEGQVSSVLKVPVLAEIPRQKDHDQREGQSVADIVVKTPLSIFSESMRRIRAGLDQAIRRMRPGADQQEQAGGVVIMVSSTSPGEGKSTISLALARTYALSGKRTILIDCDMRKPSIHKHLGFDQNVGLVDILTSDAAMPEAVLKRDRLSGANLILGSRAADIPTDQLILSPNFRRLIKACRKGFDIIIIDTPPVGPVVDATNIVRFADAVLFVTRWSTTRQSEARAALARLSEAAEQPLPTLAVLNQQEGFSARYYNSKYAGYYSET